MATIDDMAFDYAMQRGHGRKSHEHFVAGANYVLECIEEATNICFDEELRKVIEQLKK